jgi:hypothetical protein
MKIHGLLLAAAFLPVALAAQEDRYAQITNPKLTSHQRHSAQRVPAKEKEARQSMQSSSNFSYSWIYKFK